MTSIPAANPLILFACSDLMFSSRINAEARACGAQTQPIAGDDDVAAALHAHPTAVCLLVDLERGDPALTLIARARAAAPDLRIIAFGPHVDHDHLDAALAHGADAALPRSRFVAQLPQLLRLGS